MKLQGTPYCSGVGGEEEKKTKLTAAQRHIKKKTTSACTVSELFEDAANHHHVLWWNYVKWLHADKYPSGCKNSLFLLELGNNKEGEVFEQHEAHQERNGTAHGWGYDDGERVVHHPHCRQGQKTWRKEDENKIYINLHYFKNEQAAQWGSAGCLLCSYKTLKLETRWYFHMRLEHAHTKYTWWLVLSDFYSYCRHFPRSILTISGEFVLNPVNCEWMVDYLCSFLQNFSLQIKKKHGINHRWIVHNLFNLCHFIFWILALGIVGSFFFSISWLIYLFPST